MLQESRPYLNKKAPQLRKPTMKIVPKHKNEELIVTSSIVLDKRIIQPADKKVVQNQLTSSKLILKRANNDHTLNVVNRKRLLGICVYCLKNPKNDKKKLPKVTSFCPKCPEGCWMCEACFDEIHHLNE